MRFSSSARLVAWLAAALFTTACAQHAVQSSSSSAPTPEGGSDDGVLTCVHSDTGVHRLVSHPSTDGRVVGIVRGTDRELIRNASVVTMTSLSGGSTLRARADSSGRFAVEKVAPGSYELRIVSIGYLTSRDTITIAQGGASLELTQVIMRFLDEQVMCGYLAAVDSEPPLAPARAVTTTATHEMPDGGSVKTTLSIRPQPDGAVFDVVYRNVGNVPVDITRLCYPAIAGTAVRMFAGHIGPACYGVGMKLAPGDTVGLAQSVLLRGAPGDYSLRAHVVDPVTLDAVVTVPLVRGRLPRRTP